MRLQTDPDPDAPQTNTKNLSIVRFYFVRQSRVFGIEHFAVIVDLRASRGVPVYRDAVSLHA